MKRKSKNIKYLLIQIIQIYKKTIQFKKTKFKRIY